MTKSDKEIIQIAHEVLNTEAKAVKDLIPRLDKNFLRAVELLSKTKTRVILTGMGKSGLIGRKIAATLTSCGTPATFVHAAEAGHGDLGMIMKDDVIIAISHSGETKEIVELLEFVKRIGIKLICFTGNKKSKLAKYSNVVLDTSVDREAGLKGLVPSASTTATMAIGDALAIALMEKKGFGEKDFASFHPKGQIGRKLLKEERLMGIITDGDLRRMLMKYKEKLPGKTAQDCMTKNPAMIEKQDLATKALNIMERKKITSLIIKNKEQKIEGIIHLHDLWRTEMF